MYRSRAAADPGRTRDRTLSSVTSGLGFLLTFSPGELGFLCVGYVSSVEAWT